MEQAVVGAVLGASVKVLLQNLLSFSEQEISLVRDFKKDLEKMKNSFFMIQDFLYDAEMQQVNNKAVKRWLKNLEDVAFDADNVLDHLNYKFLSKKIKAKKKMKRKVRLFFSCSNPITHRRKMGDKIRKISTELEYINKEAGKFGLQTRLVSSHVSTVGSDASVYSETDSFTVDPIVMGRENDLSKIVNVLTANLTEKAFSILPIVGMGGLGKTTLARLVFADEKIMTHYESRVWVHVSKNFDAVNLFKNILASLTTENVETASREVVLKKLQKSLGDKRYLLVLDNIWNEEREKWDSFINSLEGISSVKGNGIIVTTRSATVASIVKTLDIHRLKGLSDDDCWSIIKAKAFGEGDAPSEFETTGRNIAKRCQGLPLAAKVVGGLLCNKSREEWLSIEKNWLSDRSEDENTLLRILKLSFDHLSSSSLKKCFAYCAIFSKGVYIRREELIELWMAEGFLQTDQRTDMETVGIKNFDLLLQNSLLQAVKKDGYGNISHCNVHDLVHDLACSVLGSQSICVNDNTLEDIYKARYIGRKFVRDQSRPLPKEQAGYLRTLFFEGKVSDVLFSDFKSLHVLVLMNRDVKELPNSIRELIHLRYLDVSHTSIGCLPDSIGELYHLQTLRAEECLRKLPNTLKYLISLRHLHISNIELPPEIGRLTSLQSLPYFQVGNEKGHGIVELGSLENLKGKLEIHNLEKVHDEEEAKSAYLFDKPNLFKLKFVWNEHREDEADDENVLEGLQPHSNLKSLHIHGFKGRRFPLWTLKMAVRDHLEGCWIGLNNLIQVKLTSCTECEEIPTLGHLPFLKSLYLCDLTNVRCISSSFYGNGNSNTCSSSKFGVREERIIRFQALKWLELSEMPNLREWLEAELPSTAESQQCEVAVFPCLEYLKIKSCRKLMSAPSHFPSLEVLEISDMDSGLPLSSICGIKLNSLKKLIINRLDKLVCLPDGLFYNNQNLSYLRIRGCSNLTRLVLSLEGGGATLRELYIVDCLNLRELPNDLRTLNSLENLSIVLCPNLKSIPYPSGGQSQGFTSLRHLKIGRCNELSALPSEMLESCALCLESLSLYRLSSLMNLPVVLGCLSKMPRLTFLDIDAPKFTNSLMKIASLHALQELIICHSTDSWDYVSFKVSLDGMFQGLRSLRRLSLYGKEHWDSVPEELLYLTALLHYN